MLEIGALTQKPAGLVRFYGKTVAEADRLWFVRQVIQPKLPISCELVRCAISGVLFKQMRESAKGTLAEVAPNSKISIDFSQAPCDQRAAETIHHDMMVARVKIESVRGHLKQRVSEQRSA